MGSAGEQPPREIVEYRFDTWQPAQLQRLELMLSSHDISRVWAGIHLEIGADSEERVDEWIDEIGVASEVNDPLEPTAARLRAGAPIRFFAFLLDQVMLVSVPAATMWALIGSSAEDSRRFMAIGAGLLPFVLVVLEAAWGTTPGKRLLGLHVVSADGTRIGLRGALMRRAWWVAGLVPLVGGLLSLLAALAIAVTISTSDLGEGWHDRLAGSRVVRRQARSPVARPAWLDPA